MIVDKNILHGNRAFSPAEMFVSVHLPQTSTNICHVAGGVAKLSHQPKLHDDQHNFPPRWVVREDNVNRCNGEKPQRELTLTIGPTSPFSPFSPGGPGKPCKKKNKEEGHVRRHLRQNCTLKNPQTGV